MSEHRSSTIEGKNAAGELGRPADTTARKGRGTPVQLFPFHPFLLAGASVLALYANNVKEASFLDVLPVLGAVLGFALLVFLGMGIILREFGARTGLLTTIVLIGCLFSVQLASWVMALTGDMESWVARLVLALLLIALFVFIARTQLDLRLPHSLLNGIALMMALTPIGQVVWYKWQIPRPDPIVSSIGVPSTSTETRPDIVYLIFDRYASARTLERYFGIDPLPMTTFLKERGFYVATGSHANYLKTGHSLASTFQMDYLDLLSEGDGRRSSDWGPIHAMLDEHRVARFVKSAGYRYVQVGSWWSPTQDNPHADLNPQFGFREFASIYTRDIGLHPLMAVAAPETSYTRSLQWDYGQCQRVPWQVEQIKKAVADEAGPSFVFGHILLPHEPFVFDPAGRCLSEEEANIRGRTAGYIDQVHYANKVIEDLVTTLQGSEKNPPIIILQGDEGPFPETDVGHARSWQDATHDELQIKMGILNAYYFPDHDYGTLYPSITPVNSFRILFNKYFDAQLSLLPDRIYGFPDIFRLYDFFEITHQVRSIED
ncbi:MAG TPA: sulfatase-like hydrolase/transferase [Geminicoccus sp.]|jgi:hypothetical protein|uniref:sulfatase-like hydrolase/transferase n=1 Tax=Geminicoccus sp. TaxID=2024832 RepID=UPI002E30EFF9|nr:sulfatase-like hydrolase/transferase [Geminicoccus sp.]HEX2529053.1 sulfatase-like hydrolase/transferase [Geminicoccus sp.]